jgi:hypothetical protein
MSQITTTPARITPAIMKLCHELVPDGQPKYLAVNPVPNADVNDCFPLVESYVRDHGGSVCYGWQIWEWSGIMIEAEFHAVWRSFTGELRDLTPKQVPVTRILFMPDTDRQYKGRQVDNVRRSLSSNPQVENFIKACEAEFELLNRGDRATQHGILHLTGEEAREYDEINRHKDAFYAQIISRLPKPGRNAPCICGSGVKYKKCCGR